jgi:phosphoribosylformylglycinamidine synthase
MLGLMEGLTYRISIPFKKAGDLIYLIGKPENDIASSQYLYSFHKVKESPAPAFNLDYEYSVHQAYKKIAKAGLLQSAHDVADGGLFIALAESAMPYGLGFEINTSKTVGGKVVRKDAFLFGESQSRIVVSIAAENQKAFESACETDFLFLGKVTEAKSFIIDSELIITTQEASTVYENTLPSYLN